MTVDELQVLITANTNELRKEIAKANQSISGLKKGADKSAGGVASVFKKLKTGIVALGIGKVIKDSITSGMEAIETESLFETVMGDQYEATKAWSNQMADALGLSAVNMQKNIGVIYNMTDSMGVAEKNALKMSKGISVLAEDMASFYNLDSAEAFNKLRAGLTGETEPLKALGILVDENTVKQTAYSAGIAEVGAELTQEQKVLARYTAILNQTSNAQGDLAKTLTSPSNQLRSLKQNVTNAGIALSQFFMPAVKIVLPWLNALAKVATQALNSLASFFGLVDDDVGEETEKAKNNVAGIGDGLDDATKKAKKMKNALAGFDEMNVLSDNSASDDSSGVSGGTATVGLDFDLGDYDAHLELLDGKTNELVEKIKGAFSSVGEGIKWDNLLTSFDKLKKAAEPITGKIWDGLKWAFDNILTPLAQWTINDAVPALLNGISGGLDLLNPLLESFQKLGGWLWDNFLSPIAAWTGGVIVDVLNGTGDALSAIGEWASKNQGVIDAMVFSFSAFFAVWELTNLLAFIQMSGGLVGAFNSIKTAVEACTIAKIKDGLETMYLKALYAGDFLKSIVTSTGALLKQAGQWAITTGAKALDAIQTGLITIAQGAWNVICAVGTAVTTALGAAFTFLTSPIGLVVLAIAAVIAIVVLCIKYWDEIKEVAAKCWDGIVNVWNTVADWFSVHVIEPIKNFFSGMWDGIKKIFTTCINWIKENWQGLLLLIVNPFAGAFKLLYDNCEGFRKFIENLWTSIKEIFSKIGKFISDTLGTAFKTAINFVLSTAVKIINGFISAINIAIGIINAIPGVEIKKLTKLEVPKLAKGGIVDKPTYAMIGEAGKEAVMPLERNTGWIDQLASKIGEKIGCGDGGMRLTVKLGEESIFDKFIEYSRGKAFETNGEVVFA